MSGLAPMSAKRERALRDSGRYQSGSTFARPAARPMPGELPTGLGLGTRDGVELALNPAPGEVQWQALKPRKPPRRASEKRQALGWQRMRSGLKAFPRAIAALITRRDGCCQRCGNTERLHRHHRRAKGIGGDTRAHSQCACNGLLLCGWSERDGLGGCHRWVHEHPQWARAEGFIVSQETACPGDVGVMRLAATDGGMTMWPACDGNWLETAPEAGEAA